jgi:hypothetical protein
MIFNSIIPLPFYTAIFYNFILVLVILAALHLFNNGYDIGNLKKKDALSISLLLFALLYMGLRPISSRYFGDTVTYSNYFKRFQSGGEIKASTDMVWHIFMKFCSSIMTVKMFFVVCAFLYVTPLYLATKKWLSQDSYLLFLMLIASFSFWTYGTNGIRNGIATSLFILGLSYSNKKHLSFSIIILSYFVHSSIIIPGAAFILSLFYKNSKHYLLGWLLAIPLSIGLGGFWESLFMSLGFGDDRTSYLTDTRFADQFSSVGFRWDFLAYSATAVFAGYYFIIVKKFEDKIYIQLFNIYVTANAFWVLLIRASFSNRFAYLSWFLMALVIFYPFFKAAFFKDQPKVLARTIIGYFGFTYFMFLIN